MRSRLLDIGRILEAFQYPVLLRGRRTHLSTFLDACRRVLVRAIGDLYQLFRTPAQPSAEASAVHRGSVRRPLYRLRGPCTTVSTRTVSQRSVFTVAMYSGWV